MRDEINGKGVRNDVKIGEKKFFFLKSDIYFYTLLPLSLPSNELLFKTFSCYNSSSFGYFIWQQTSQPQHSPVTLSDVSSRIPSNNKTTRV